MQYPEVLTDAEKKTVALLSFPDSNSFNTVGDIVFLFKSGNDFCYVFFR